MISVDRQTVLSNIYGPKLNYNERKRMRPGLHVIFQKSQSRRGWNSKVSKSAPIVSNSGNRNSGYIQKLPSVGKRDPRTGISVVTGWDIGKEFSSNKGMIGKGKSVSERINMVGKEDGQMAFKKP